MGRYEETEFRELLPAFMRSDAFDDAMADVIDTFGADAFSASRPLSVWDHVGDMDEASLDALADELNIPWYGLAATVEEKRGVVANCKHIQAKLGTKWALEEVLNLYFSGNTVVTEWFDYPERGEPCHFTIETENTATAAEEAARFLAVMSQVKRKSAVLDKILAVIGSRSTPSAAAMLQGRNVVHMQARREI